MRKLAVLMAGALSLGACGSDGGGQGFALYEVTPSGAQGPERAEIGMPGLPAVPRHLVREAASAVAAAAVRPYPTNREASVAAVTVENTWLRVVDAGGSVWLVAEAGQGAAPDPGRLRSEVVQRSGCLATGAATVVGRSTVFLLDCS